MGIDVDKFIAFVCVSKPLRVAVTVNASSEETVGIAAVVLTEGGEKIIGMGVQAIAPFDSRRTVHWSEHDGLPFWHGGPSGDSTYRSDWLTDKYVAAVWRNAHGHASIRGFTDGGDYYRALQQGAQAPAEAAVPQHAQDRQEAAQPALAARIEV
jgi:hypothetical protein